MIIGLQLTSINRRGSHNCSPENEYKKRKIVHASLKTADFNVYVLCLPQRSESNNSIK